MNSEGVMRRLVRVSSVHFISIHKPMIPSLPLLFLAVIFLPVTKVFAGTIQLPKTGQTFCSDTVGNLVSCNGTGQDGEFKAGMSWPLPRFSVGLGTESDCIADSLTGLMWIRYPDASNRIWLDALNFINNLTFFKQNTFWSSTTVSDYPSQAWTLYLSDGTLSKASKISSYKVFRVRGPIGAHVVNLPSTGQVNCYDTSGNVIS